MYNQGKIIKRLLGRPNTDIPVDAGLDATSSASPQTYRPKESQNAVYPSSVPVASVDRSPDGRIAVLGGRHVLKTIHIDGLDIKEGIDVRAAITSQYANKAGAASLASEQLSIKDAKVASQHGAEPTIFTACANGKVFMYDVNRLASGLGLDFIQSSEGSRQVNKLDFNPHRGTWLLAGGQDGVVRCFDVKAPVQGRNGPTFRTFLSLRGNDDGIRDLKWAPNDGMMFACGTESGAILKWDIRRPTQPLLKINAHDPQKGVSSISWHPDGDHLISSGPDGKCYVWDLSKNAEKRQKAKWTINAPAPVAAVSWRPGLWSATARGRRAAQVAVTYDDSSNQKSGISSVHIWDFARPTMPYKEIEMFEASPTALLWHSQDLLWAVGRHGFTQCDVAFAPKVMDRRPLSSLDFSPRGEVLMVLEERNQIARPRGTVKPHSIAPTPSVSSSPSGQMLSFSRSDSEEDVIGSFLGPKRQLGGKRRSAHRAGPSLSTTPPSGSGAEDQVISLEHAIKLTIPFKTQQVMAIGRVPASTKVDTYHFLSQQYLEILGRDLPRSENTGPLDERILGIMSKYARVAESVSQFRLAQTWRILSYAMNLLLTSRSKYHLECRLTNTEGNSSPERRDHDARPLPLTIHSSSSSQLRDSGEETPRRLTSIPSTESRSTPGKLRLVEEVDSDSGVPTPLARPVEDDSSEVEGTSSTAKRLTPVHEVESFSLPPAVHPGGLSPRRRLDSTSLSIAVETLPIAINPPKKEPLRIDPMEPRSPNSRRKPGVRLDSDESFSQMFSLSDTSRQASLVGTSSKGSVQQTASPLLRKDSNDADSEHEFASRIRGKQIKDSPRPHDSPLPQPFQRYGSDLTEDFMVSQTTTDTFESGSTDFEMHQHPAEVKPGLPAMHGTASQSGKTAPRPQDHKSPTITETDFLPWDGDPSYPYPINSGLGPRNKKSPIKPYEILAQAVAFESRRSALNASAMVLLLKPLMPDDIIDSHQAAAILRQYHQRLMNMKLFVEAAMLRNLCLRGWPSGMEFWGENYSAIFRPAQERVAGGFSCAQCHKPREISRSSSEGSEIWRCERCRALVAPCAVCGHREAASESTSVTLDVGLASASTQSEDSILSTWWYCPGCSHGGHANCLQDWHAPIISSQQSEHHETTRVELFEDDSPHTNSDGCCPFDGCGHACLPGRWRNESTTARSEELGRAVREQYRGVITDLKKVDSRHKLTREASAISTPAGSVRGDNLEIPQSRAVETVREVLANTSHDKNDKPGGLMSILSSSPGRGGSFATGGGVERERRKSVKFAG
ncbi:putative WD domain-containing protein [Rosellinia necatrix]|uniref:Putative WD domain-containing protein n=1 Tax=Rosellinia necatrix TaxID=77044 RepID=A0A1W2TJ24_ROSNE|nr:putative WD domain-containing protein [Rosellinia necatrix]